MQTKPVNYIKRLQKLPSQYWLITIMIAIVMSILLLILSKKMRYMKKLSTRRCFVIALFVSYYFFIISATILHRWGFPNQKYNLQLLWSWKDQSLRSEVIANIAMFIPLGFISTVEWRWHSIWLGTICSLIVEVSQLLTHRGSFELDDLLNNTIGTFIGCVLYFATCHMFRISKKQN